MAASFTFSSFSIRFVLALTLVMLTFNPTGYSFYHLAVTQISPTQEALVSLPVLLLCGILLAIAWVIYMRATLRSLGPVGISLVAALFACVIWVLVDLKWLVLQGIVFQYVVLVIVALVLGIGMSWSHVRRRISGQADMDDVDQ
ncbi:DUF6524 family protein [Eionea flava]